MLELSRDWGLMSMDFELEILDLNVDFYMNDLEECYSALG